MSILNSLSIYLIKYLSTETLGKYLKYISNNLKLCKKFLISNENKDHEVTLICIIDI